VVLVSHAGGALFPAVAGLNTHFLQLGQFGVSTFFLCSGFVIPFSMGKGDALGAFWIRRFFRLFPLFWLSLAAALALRAAGLFTIEPAFDARFGWSLFANIVMMPKFLGAPAAIGVYWTLSLELVFYVALTIMVWRRLQHRTWELTLLLFGLAVLSPVLTRALDRPPHAEPLFHLATMFFGTQIYRFRQGSLSRPKFTAAAAVAALSMLLTTGIAFYGRDDVAHVGTRSFLPMLMAWASAYSLFGLALAASRLSSFDRFWRGFTWLGTLSYSIYLWHVLVMHAVPELGNPVATLALWIGVVLLLSHLSYRWVELPAIDWGRRLSRNPRLLLKEAFQ
jgi:peptidoglycan/LPS O-acetylase OafA/YrhL